MATLLLRPLPLALGLSLGCATAYTAHTFFHRPQPQFTSLLSAFGPQKLRCDAFPAGTLRGEYARYQDEARTPIVKGGKLNGEAVREFTKGSVAGLLGGVAISLFSKPLALLLGVLFLGAQALESRGIRIIPYSRLQSLFTGTNVRSALEDNVAFKVSFGLAFALAGFMEF